MEKLTDIKNLLFDFGGVIVNINKNNAVRRFKEIGVNDIEDYLGEYCQQGIFLQLENGTIGREKFYDELRNHAGKYITDEDIDSAWMAFMDGIPEYKLQLLEELRGKYNLYLLSNTNPIIMEWADSKNLSPLGKPLSAYFNKMFCSYQIGYTKPQKETFEAVIEGSGIDPKETLFLDDGQSNLDAAKEFGFKTYLVDQNEDLRTVFNK